MTDPRYIGRILYVGLAIFATLLTAGLLMQERRYSVKKTALLWSLEGLALLVNLYVCFGLLPVPLRLPVSLTVGFFSYAGVFIAVSADGFWKKIYLLITFFCVCCIAWSGGLYLCYFLLPDSAPVRKPRPSGANGTNATSCSRHHGSTASRASWRTRGSVARIASACRHR